MPMEQVAALVIGALWPLGGERGWRALLTMLDLAVVAGNPYLNFSIVRRVNW